MCKPTYLILTFLIIYSSTSYAQCIKQKMEGDWVPIRSDAGSPSMIRVRFNCPDVVSCNPTCTTPEFQAFVSVTGSANESQLNNVGSERLYYSENSAFINRADIPFPQNTSKRLALSLDPNGDLISSLTQMGSGSNHSIARTGIYERKIKPESITLYPNPTTAGNTVEATVQLEDSAPTRGIVIKLHSSNENIAQVPDTLAILGGERTGTFTINTNPNICPSSVSISAEKYGNYASSRLSLTSNIPRPNQPSAFHVRILQKPIKPKNDLKIGNVFISWNPQTNVEKFVLRRYANGVATTRWDIPGNESRYSVRQMQPCVTYYYKLQAYSSLCYSQAAGPIGIKYDDGSCPLQ